MPKKKQIPEDEAFEKMYRKFYVENIEALFNALPSGTQVYPNADKAEKIFQDCLKMKCTYRILYTPSAGLIEPLIKDDNKYPFAGAMHIKKFFEKYVHRSFLIPYWLYAGFAYRLAGMQQITRTEILETQYQVELPVKFPQDKDYGWYLQQSKVLTVNEHNHVLTHVNTYTLLKPLAAKKFSETSLIQATVLHNEKLNEKFAALLKEQLAAYFKTEVFTKMQERLVLKYYSDKIKTKSPYTESYRLDLNKSILKKMQEYTGYKFKDILQVVSYLQDISAL